MIIGRIDEFGRALLVVSLRATSNAPSQELEVWVDTGFTGELVLSESQVNQLGLPQSAMVAAALADGSESVLQTFSCVIDWFGESRAIEVVASQGRMPLLGVGLLWGHRFVVDYEQLTLSLE
jgi:clan AA aspartic protease